MKYEFEGKGYWEQKPMRQQLECISQFFDFPANEGVLHPVDMEGLIKIGVRFPEVEETFKD